MNPSTDLIQPTQAQTAPQTLHDWLTHAEAMHPRGSNGITLGLERVLALKSALGLVFTCPVITVAGTNGKGSTCAMLERIYREAGYQTGVFTSPHLVHFEERCAVNGSPVAPERLAEAFAQVEQARLAAGLTLSYFEFTTLGILSVLAHTPLDVVVLEVGLGGRLDAVNAVDADCAIITSIDLDHTEFLGDTREKIGWEKAHIMRPACPAVVSDPLPPASLAQYAAQVGADLWLLGRDFAFGGDKQQWRWGTLAGASAAQPRHSRHYAGLAYPALRGANQLANAAGVLAAIEALRPRLPVTAQAVRNGLAMVELPGRFQILPGQPTLVLDVAHNPHSVAALVANLDAMGFYPQTHAVVGAMADKDLDTMLRSLLPLVTHWYCTDLPTPRAAAAADLAKRVQRLAADYQAQQRSWPLPTVSAHVAPPDALQAAAKAAQSADRIVVLGSFYTVGGVLSAGLPKLHGAHSA